MAEGPQTDLKTSNNKRWEERELQAQEGQAPALLTTAAQTDAETAAQKEAKSQEK